MKNLSLFILFFTPIALANYRMSKVDGIIICPAGGSNGIMTTYSLSEDRKSIIEETASSWVGRISENEYIVNNKVSDGYTFVTYTSNQGSGISLTLSDQGDSVRNLYSGDTINTVCRAGGK